MLLRVPAHYEVHIGGDVGRFRDMFVSRVISLSCLNADGMAMDDEQAPSACPFFLPPVSKGLVAIAVCPEKKGKDGRTVNNETHALVYSEPVVK